MAAPPSLHAYYGPDRGAAAREKKRARQWDLARFVAQRRRFVRTEAGPTEDEVAERVVLQKDFATAASSGPEVGFTVDASTNEIAAYVTGVTTFAETLLAASDLPTLLKLLYVGNHEQYAPVFQDFHPTGAQSCGFNQSVSGTGAEVNQAFWAIDSSSNAIGAQHVAAGTSGTGFASMHTWNNVIMVNTGTRFRLTWRLCIETLATASDDYWFEVGFGKGLDSGTGADLIVFRYKRSVSTNWYAVTKKDGTETVADTGVAVAAGTGNCVILEIDVAADGSQVVFDINTSGGVATHTTNIPTNVTGDRMGYGMYIQQTAYSATNPRIAADWMLFEPIRTAAR